MNSDVLDFLEEIDNTVNVFAVSSCGSRDSATMCGKGSTR